MDQNRVALATARFKPATETEVYAVASGAAAGLLGGLAAHYTLGISSDINSQPIIEISHRDNMSPVVDTLTKPPIDALGGAVVFAVACLALRRLAFQLGHRERRQARAELDQEIAGFRERIDWRTNPTLNRPYDQD